MQIEVKKSKQGKLFTNSFKLPACRASFLNVLNPIENKDPKTGEVKGMVYTATLLFPLSAAKKLLPMQQAIKEMIRLGLGKSEKAMEKFWLPDSEDPVLSQFQGAPDGCHFPIVDAEEAARKKREEPRSEEVGMFRIRTKTGEKYPPTVKIRLGEGQYKTCDDPAKIYSGCYIVPEINLSFFSVQGTYGVTCYLSGVLKVADGEPISGFKEASFEEDEIDMGALPEDASVCEGGAEVSFDSEESISFS